MWDETHDFFAISPTLHHKTPCPFGEHGKALVLAPHILVGHVIQSSSLQCQGVLNHGTPSRCVHIKPKILIVAPPTPIQKMLPYLVIIPHQPQRHHRHHTLDVLQPFGVKVSQQRAAQARNLKKPVRICTVLISAGTLPLCFWHSSLIFQGCTYSAASLCLVRPLPILTIVSKSMFLCRKNDARLNERAWRRSPFRSVTKYAVTKPHLYRILMNQTPTGRYFNTQKSYRIDRKRF